MFAPTYCPQHTSEAIASEVGSHIRVVPHSNCEELYLIPVPNKISPLRHLLVYLCMGGSKLWDLGFLMVYLGIFCPIYSIPKLTLSSG